MNQFKQISDAVKNKVLTFSQSQASTTEQLMELKAIANTVGLYDAADAIQRLIDQSSNSPKKNNNLITN